MDALLNKGAALYSGRRYAEAILCYDAMLGVDGKCAMALAYKGLSLGESGWLQEAITYFKRALSIDNEFDLAAISKGMQRISSNRQGTKSRCNDILSCVTD